MIVASNSWLLAFDNLSYIRSELSDALCCLATGGGFGTRELYSDDEEKLFSAQRPVAVNGIDDLATRSDLLDRAVQLHLPVIPAEHRHNQSELDATFAAIRPRVLGALLSAVSTAIRLRATVNLPTKPRMADFATWVTAAESALGWERGAFIRAYERNRDEASILAIEVAVVGPALLRLLGRVPVWRGTAGDLLQTLEREAPYDERKRRRWPFSPRGMAGALRRLAPNLRAAGYLVQFTGEGTGNDRKRMIEICRAP
jgi:hypothetical protein